MSTVSPPSEICTYIHTHTHCTFIHIYVVACDSSTQCMQKWNIKSWNTQWGPFTHTYVLTHVHRHMYVGCTRVCSRLAPLQRHKTSSVCGIGWVSTAVLPLLKVWTWEEVRVTAKSVILLLMFCGMMVTQKSLFTISDKWSFFYGVSSESRTSQSWCSYFVKDILFAKFIPKIK